MLKYGLLNARVLVSDNPCRGSVGRLNRGTVVQYSITAGLSCDVESRAVRVCLFAPSVFGHDNLQLELVSLNPKQTSTPSFLFISSFLSCASGHSLLFGLPQVLLILLRNPSSCTAS